MAEVLKTADAAILTAENEELLGEPAVSRVVCLADIAKRGWNSGLRLAQISKNLAPDMRAGLRRALLHSVVDSIDKVRVLGKNSNMSVNDLFCFCMDVSRRTCMASSVGECGHPLEQTLLLLQDTELVQRAVSAAQSIITAACTDADDKDDVLDTLLRPRHGWPQYVHLEGDGVEKGKGAIESTSGRPETLSELAYALGTGLGFNSILYDADGRNRQVIKAGHFHGPHCSDYTLWTLKAVPTSWCMQVGYGAGIACFFRMPPLVCSTF